MFLAALVVALGAATGSAGAMNWEPAAGSPFAAGVNNPASLAMADLNEDGHLDVVVGNNTETGATISVLLGDGNGGLQAASTPLVTGTIPVALDVADLSNDGNLDVVAGNKIPDDNNGRGSVSLYLGDGNGGLTPAGDPMSVGGAVSALALGDFTGDQTPDAAVAHAPNPEDTSNFRFTIAGAIGTGEDGGFYPFQQESIGGGRTMRVGDLNSDGRADAVLDHGGDVVVYLGQASNGVTHATGCSIDCGNQENSNGVEPGSLTLGDYNGDGKLDVAVGSFSNPSVTVLIGDGAGALTRLTPAVNTFIYSFHPSAVGAGDFNRDGLLDVAATDGYHNSFMALFGDGAGHLATSVQVPTGGTGGPVHGRPEALRVGDFDEDGWPDAVVANLNDGTVSVLLYRYGHVRPRSANSMQVPLVPAYARCVFPRNRTHGPPQDVKSCSPPSPLSGLLTLGTADFNQRATNSTGSVRIEAIAGLPSTPADEADMRVTTNITDVRNTADLSDYTGSVDVVLGTRLTDRVGESAGEGSQTMQDLPLEVPVPCSATSETTIGATCQLTTTVDSIVPGAVLESKRSVWALDAVRILDADGGLFEKQGYFVP